MADENQIPATASTQAAPAPENTPRVLDSGTISQLNALGIDRNDSAAMAELGFGDMTSDPDKGDNNSTEYLQQQSQGEHPELNSDSPSVEEQALASQQAAAQPDQEAPTQENAPATVDHPMFGGKTDFSVKQPETPELKGSEEINKFIAGKFDGVENVESLISNHEQLKAQMEEYKVIKEEFDRVDTSFKNMPPELLKAIDMAEKGEDWKSFFNNSPSLDFGQDVDSVSKEALVQTYFGDQFTKDDFEAADPDSDYYDANVERMVNLAYGQAKDKFNSDKASRTLTLEDARISSENKNKAYTESVGNSLGSIKEYMPTASDEYLSSINEDFLQSKQNSLFSNQDGTVKADAALRYALAKDGPEIFQQMQKVVQDKAETIARQELLLRQSQTPPRDNGTSAQGKAQGGIRPGFENFVNNL